MPEPSLEVRPQPLAWAPVPSTVTVTWAGADEGRWEVRVSIDEGEERLFAAGSSGSQAATWIRSDRRHVFRLVPPGGGAAVLERAVEIGPIDAPGRRPMLSASPNPVPLTAHPGFTTITWDTGDGSPGSVWLLQSVEGRERASLVAKGPAGQRGVAGISRDRHHRFRLMDARGRRELAATTVVMGSPRRELLLDLAVLAVAGLVMATPVLLAVLGLRAVGGRWWRLARAGAPTRAGRMVRRAGSAILRLP